jgi:hypothetical protein
MSEDEIRQKVLRNAGIGLDPASSRRVLDMDPPERILGGLEDLHASYTRALQAELEMPISTMEKNLTIETAMSLPTMNLHLISDRTTRETLVDQWQDLAMGGLTGGVGLPSVPSVSGNVRSESVYYNMPQPLPGERPHPSTVLMSGRAVSISNERTGERAMTVSSANIPTPRY